MLHFPASDPLFPEWNELLTSYAALLNPACHFNLREVDTEAAEYKADVTVWREHVEEEYRGVIVMKQFNLLRRSL